MHVITCINFSALTRYKLSDAYLFICFTTTTITTTTTTITPTTFWFLFNGLFFQIRLGQRKVPNE